jgi:hypothetical protein
MLNSRFGEDSILADCARHPLLEDRIALRAVLASGARDGSATNLASILALADGDCQDRKLLDDVLNIVLLAESARFAVCKVFAE